MLVLNKCFLNIEMISESRLFDYVKILYWSNSTKTMKIQQNFYTPHKKKILFNSYHHIFSKKNVITEASPLCRHLDMKLSNCQWCLNLKDDLVSIND